MELDQELRGGGGIALALGLGVLIGIFVARQSPGPAPTPQKAQQANATYEEYHAGELENRAHALGTVDERLGQFEKRMAKWDLVEQELARSLEQIAAPKSTITARPLRCSTKTLSGFI